MSGVGQRREGEPLRLGLREAPLRAQDPPDSPEPREENPDQRREPHEVNNEAPPNGAPHPPRPPSRHAEQNGAAARPWSQSHSRLNQWGPPIARAIVGGAIVAIPASIAAAYAKSSAESAKGSANSAGVSVQAAQRQGQNPASQKAAAGGPPNLGSPPATDAGTGVRKTLSRQNGKAAAPAKLAAPVRGDSWRIRKRSLFAKGRSGRLP